MKSEHRHELKHNDLAQSLMTFQDYLKHYGGRVALGVVIGVLIIVLIFQRRSSARKNEIKLSGDLGFAREQIDRLKPVEMLGQQRFGAKPSQMGNVRQILQEVREKAEPAMQSEALILQGELAWTLANFPVGPGVDPSYKPDQEPAEFLKQARDAYQQVVGQFGDQPIKVAIARFGLAAVAEAERNFDEARKQYEAVKSMPNAWDRHKAHADDRLRNLEQLTKPVLIGQVPDKPEPPPFVPELPPTTTRESTTGAATGATTHATTRAAPPKTPTGATTHAAPPKSSTGANAKPVGRATTRPSSTPTTKTPGK
jgi:hypothetical protein